MDKLKYWGKVDLYDGGMEHATRHLLYARFWNIFLCEQKIVPNSEPFDTRISHGMILGSTGEKMSKSKGNVVNPNDMIRDYGADALRVYEMFIGDYTKDAAWNENGLKGCKKFLDRVYRAGEKLNLETEYSKDMESLIHKTIKKVSEDIENLSYNTAVSALMILINEYDKHKSISKEDYRVLLQLLNPFAPHITEELNEKYSLGDKFSESRWPNYDFEKTIDDMVELGVQVNGKLRASITLSKDSDNKLVEDEALKQDNVLKFIKDKEIVKIIVVPNRIVNIVVK
jgi:leucyl-tRNA synthetase